MAETRAGRGKAPPGEYVVRHERPYPERLERAFRIAARVLAIAAGTVAGGIAATRLPYPEAGRNAFFIASGFTLGAGLAWGSVHAIGLLLGAAVTAFRRKRYVVAWQEPNPTGSKNRATWIFFGILAMFALWAAAASRWL